MVSKEQMEHFRWLWQLYLEDRLSREQHAALMEMLSDKAYENELQALLLSIDSRDLPDPDENGLTGAEALGLWEDIGRKTGQKLIGEEHQALEVKGRKTIFRLQKKAHRIYLGAAAAILFAFAVAMFYRWQLKGAGDGLRVSQNEASQQSSAALASNAAVVTYARPYLELPDGSVVRLNKNASLTIDTAAFNRQGQRLVRLKGEAYFKVVHNPKSPFIVICAGVETIDIGTAFNINSKDGKVQVTVIEGEVQLKNKDKNLSHLTASQQLTLNLKTQQVELRSAVNAEKVIAWTGNSLDFDGITLDSSIHIINQRFDVNIQVAPQVKDNKIKASFTGNDSVENILEVLASICGAEIERTDKGVIRIKKNSSL